MNIKSSVKFEKIKKYLAITSVSPYKWDFCPFFIFIPILLLTKQKEFGKSHYAVIWCPFYSQPAFSKG